MNNLVTSIKNQEHMTLTENGRETYESSLDSCVDLFFTIGALRGQDTFRLKVLFEKAYSEDADLAIRIVLWVRDIRCGAGERQIFRDLLVYIEANYPEILNKILNKTPELGRWDDILVVKSKAGKKHAFYMYSKALLEGNGLAAKWCHRPKKSRIANELAKYMHLTPKEFRKILVKNTKVVENQMCKRDWKNIEYGKVPSLAASRYSKAFKRHDEEGYVKYLDNVVSGTEKINAGAVYPYDVIKPLLQYDSNVDKRVITTQWEALPNMLNSDVNILPMVDISGSMSETCSPKGNLRCIHVSVSLGLYISDKNNGALKDCVLTFSSEPRIQILKGDIISKFTQLYNDNVGYSTNLDKAFDCLIDMAVKKDIPQKDMPEIILVLSDMEFDNVHLGHNEPVSKTTMKKFIDKGYNIPKIVWWNIQSRHNNIPVLSSSKDMALVSGFSPAIMQSVLNAEDFSPRGIMLKAVIKERYNWDF